ncbi:MAG: SPOR domain-containing protein [Pseudomonadota bacterium]
MNKTVIAKLAASTLVAGTVMLGGGMAGMAKSPVAASDGKAANAAADAAKKATKALAKHNLDKAIGFAEAAVEWQPHTAGYRMLLGQVYLSAGRFQAAEQSFSDTLTLDPERERAALNLALAQTALGKRDAARSTLTDYRDKLPAADFGLALALAGDPEEAVRVLEFATRAPDASAKTRQNLAFAYAMTGKWSNARVMAVQDLSADAAEARLGEWALLVRPAATYSQVASVLGVTPGSDASQPTRLALAPTAAPVQTAQAAPKVTPAQVFAAETPAPAPVAVAAAAPAPLPAPAFETAPTQVATVAPASVASPEVPFVRAPQGPVRQAVAPIIKAKPSFVPAAPRATLRPAVMTRSVSNGRFVVQLGAFSSVANAERAWDKISGRFHLAGYDPISGYTKVGTLNLTRLAISFGTREDATRVCNRIKAGGGVCFVRAKEGDAPAQWVRRNTNTRLASR